MRRLLILVAALATLTIGIGTPSAQEPTPLPSFEIASVKPNASGPGGPMMLAPRGERFVATNEGQVDRVIIDRTGLSGAVDIDLSWTPSNLLTAPANIRPEVDRTRPTIFDALQEQLGLKLVRKDGPVEVLVIDSISRPTPD